MGNNATKTNKSGLGLYISSDLMFIYQFGCCSESEIIKIKSKYHLELQDTYVYIPKSIANTAF